MSRSLLEVVIRCQTNAISQQMGVFTLNEIRQEYGLPKIENPEIYKSMNKFSTKLICEYCKRPNSYDMELCRSCGAPLVYDQTS